MGMASYARNYSYCEELVLQTSYLRPNCKKKRVEGGKNSEKAIGKDFLCRAFSVFVLYLVMQAVHTRMIDTQVFGLLLLYM